MPVQHQGEQQAEHGWKAKPTRKAGYEEAHRASAYAISRMWWHTMHARMSRSQARETRHWILYHGVPTNFVLGSDVLGLLLGAAA